MADDIKFWSPYYYYFQKLMLLNLLSGVILFFVKKYFFNYRRNAPGRADIRAMTVSNRSSIVVKEKASDGHDLFYSPSLAE